MKIHIKFLQMKFIGKVVMISNKIKVKLLVCFYNKYSIFF